MVILTDLQAQALAILLTNKITDTTEAVAIENLGVEISVKFSHGSGIETFYINSEGEVTNDSAKL